MPNACSATACRFPSGELNTAMPLDRAYATSMCSIPAPVLGEIADALSLGFDLPPTVKNKTRSGMGRCQGRMCGPILTEILADRHGIGPEKVGCFQVRPMIKPVTLSRMGEMQIAGGDTQSQS